MTVGMFGNYLLGEFSGEVEFPLIKMAWEESLNFNEKLTGVTGLDFNSLDGKH